MNQEAALTALIAVLYGASCVAALAAVYGGVERLPKDDREYKDPLPAGLKAIWPLVRGLAFVFGIVLPSAYLGRQHEKLRTVGLERLLEPAQFVALRVISAAVAAGAAAGCLRALGETDDFHTVSIIVAALALGYLFPSIWLNDIRARQLNEILKTMPVFLDYLTMSVEAGLNLSGAIEQAVDKGPEGALRAEFKRVLRDLRAGVTRAEALRKMADRLDIPVIRSFVSSLLQAERMGANMGPTLRIMADQRRTERFQRAEKMAMEAPVKLLFPLMAFIFPVTFIILAFPIAMKFMHEGLL